ncbi:MAG: hypothetical protein JJE05_03990 [Actinobacteria bacterium]|nr:hypothetical protein [Actinomycetota bacterium]
MLAVSMLLIAGSGVALGFGWITANESLVWASIVATGAAAILLALTYYLSIRAAGAPVDGSAFAPDPSSSDPPSSDVPPPETQEFEAVAEDDAGEGARPDDDRGGADEGDDSVS